MATAAVRSPPSTSPRRIGVIRFTAAAAFTAALVFVVCWLGTYLPFPNLSHAYIALFTSAPVGSALALWAGLCWSLLFGGFAAAAFAVIYNGAAGLERE